MEGSKFKSKRLKTAEHSQYVALIDRTIGKHAGRALLQLKPYIEAQAARARALENADDVSKNSDEDFLQLIELDQVQDKRIQARVQREKNEKHVKNELVAAAYLENMADQRKWFLTLEKKFCKDQGTDSKLRALFKQGRQEFEQYLEYLRENKPRYHLQEKYRQSEHFRKKKNLNSLAIKSEIVQQLIASMFENIRVFYEQGRLKKCVNEADKIKTTLEKIPRQVPLDFIHKKSERLAGMMGDVYFQSKSLQTHLTDEENANRIVGMLGFDFNRLKFDIILQSSSFPFFDAQVWRDKYKRYLKISESDLERAWLHYEVARSYVMDRDWKQVQVHGHKAAVYGKRCGSAVWQINGQFLEAVVAGRDSRHNLMNASLQDCIDVAQADSINSKVLAFLEAAQQAVAAHHKSQFSSHHAEQGNPDSRN